MNRIFFDTTPPRIDNFTKNYDKPGSEILIKVFNTEIKRLYRKNNFKRGYLITVFECDGRYFFALSIRDFEGKCSNTLYISDEKQDMVNIAKTTVKVFGSMGKTYVDNCIKDSQKLDEEEKKHIAEEYYKQDPNVKEKQNENLPN